MSEIEDKAEGTVEAPKSFGAWLKGQRIAKKVALEEIAAVTKIHLNQLKSLEEGWADVLPAMTIIRGITVCYAKHLGLNEAEVMDQFKLHQTEFTKEKASSLVKTQPPSTYTPQSGKPLRFGSYSERKDQSQLSHWVSTKRTLYAVLVLLGLGLLIFLMKLGKRSNEEVPVAPATVVDTSSAAGGTENVQPQPQETKITEQNNAGPAVPGALFAGSPPFDFTLVASGDVWFNMQVDELSLVSFKLSAGQTKKVTFNRKARITFSNPLLTKFQVNGVNYKSTAPLGKDETINFPDQANKLVADKR